MSSFDIFYRRILNKPFFGKGWGSPDLIIKLLDTIPKVSDRRMMEYLSKVSGPITIVKEESHKNMRLIEGSFISPLNTLMPDVLEGTNCQSQFQMIVPIEWRTKQKPICFHYSGTGDQNYARRRIFLANKLLEDGIGSLIIMNPYYSERKPTSQNLNFLTDLFVMGGALMAETITLLSWCDFHGFGPYALHGISMGGFMASLSAQAAHRTISLIPCLSATTASCVFVDGVLSKSVDWTTLTKQYYEDHIFSKVIRPKLTPSYPSKYQIIASDQKKREIRERLLKNERVIISETLKDAKTNTSESAVSPSLDVSTWRLLDLNRLWYNVSSPASGWGLDYSSWLNVLKQEDSINQKNVDPDVEQFMREMLDKFTHLGNFPQLKHPSLVCAVLAECDAYVPSYGVSSLSSVYPGADIRYLSQAGHVGAYLRNALWTHDFRNAICDSLNRQVELLAAAKGTNEKGIFGLERMIVEQSKKKKDINKVASIKVMGIKLPFKSSNSNRNNTKSDENNNFIDSTEKPLISSSVHSSSFLKDSSMSTESSQATKIIPTKSKKPSEKITSQKNKLG